MFGVRLLSIQCRGDLSKHIEEEKKPLFVFGIVIQICQISRKTLQMCTIQHYSDFEGGGGV